MAPLPKSPKFRKQGITVSITPQEIEAVLSKISAMAAEFGLAFLDPPPVQVTSENVLPTKFFKNLDAQTRVVGFAAFTRLFDAGLQPIDVRFRGTVSSTITSAGTEIDEVVVQKPEELQSRQRV